MVKKIYKLLLLGLFLNLNSYAQSDSITPNLVDSSANNVLDMSLEELLSVEIKTGSLVNMKQFSKPVAVTVISKEDIALSASRNMMDLLETYVPGFFWLDHPSEGMKGGMRGVISDRNLKFLLLVNGVVLYERGHRGVVAEISNWDLDDIEKIEVVRGPGSVTYGPGAIAGVISITTKRAGGENVVGASVNYKSNYQSRGLNMYAKGTSKSNIQSLLYGSIQSTDGIANPETFNAKTPVDYGLPNQFSKPLYLNPYMRDSRNVPQLKLMADFDFGKGYKFFTRYNQTGSYGNSFDRYQALSGFNSSNKAVYNGAITPSIFNKHQELLAVAEKKFIISDKFDLNTSIIYDNENSYNVRYQTSSVLNNASVDSLKLRDINSISDLSSLRHVYFQFSERQITTKAILNYTSSNNKLQGALGFDFSNTKWGAPWFGSASDIRLGDQRQIVSDSTVAAIANKGVTSATGNQILSKDGIYVGKGWNTNTLSVYGETKYDFTDKISILASARTDKDTYSNWLFSPRAAMIFDFNKHTFRLVALQSTRMNTAAQMLLKKLSGGLSSPEKLRAIEGLYTYVFSSKLITDANVFYNVTDVLGWSSSDRSVVNIGKAKTAGAEVSVTYKDKNFAFGLNHSFVKLLDWKLASNQVGSGISYSDYRQAIIYNTDRKDAANKTITDTVYISNTGSNLSNYSNNISKVFVNYMLLDKKLTLHADMRVLWGFNGMSDGLTAYKNAFDTVTSKVGQQVRDFVNSVNNNKIYKTDLRVNVSVSYKISKNTQISVFVNNLFYTNHARRYFYDSGLTALNPTKIKYTQEPRFWGVKLSCEF
ncbi:MAG: TonB-dependent receptor [Cytophagales bacterium]